MIRNLDGEVPIEVGGRAKCRTYRLDSHANEWLVNGPVNNGTTYSNLVTLLGLGLYGHTE